MEPTIDDDWGWETEFDECEKPLECTNVHDDHDYCRCRACHGTGEGNHTKEDHR